MHSLETIIARNNPKPEAADGQWFTTSSQSLQTVYIIGLAFAELDVGDFIEGREELKDKYTLHTIVYFVPKVKLPEFTERLFKHWKARRKDDFKFDRRCRSITPEKAAEIIEKMS